MLVVGQTLPGKFTAYQPLVAPMIEAWRSYFKNFKLKALPQLTVYGSERPLFVFVFGGFVLLPPPRARTHPHSARCADVTVVPMLFGCRSLLASYLPCSHDAMYSARCEGAAGHSGLGHAALGHPYDPYRPTLWPGM